MKSETLTELDFRLPFRITPQWERVASVPTSSRETTIKVMTGLLPLGLMPLEIITEEERIKIVNDLGQLKISEYDNSEATGVLVHGNPFVEARTLDQYLATPSDREFEKITTPIMNRVIKSFEIFGFEVLPLVDPDTLLPYSSKVCRHISLPKDCITDAGNACTVLHCDDILRDGFKKPDFRIPVGLKDQKYYQISVCVQLEDGGYRPDDLIVYERMYSRELEPLFYGKGRWRFPGDKVENVNRYHHTPKLRQSYFFSTLNFHDIKGGHEKSKRLNFSVFFVYVPATNTMYYYN